MNRSNNNHSERMPENDASKAMDSKRDVQNSNDEKTDQDFPGYPHYPAKEDVMDKRSDSHRIDMDAENLATGQNSSGINRRFADEKENVESNPDDDALESLDSREEEIGKSQNVSNDDLKNK